MIQVENKIRVYEINGKATEFDTDITVCSHWNDDGLIVLKTPGLNGQSYCLGAKDLIAAIANAQNIARF